MNKRGNNHQQLTLLRGHRGVDFLQHIEKESVAMAEIGSEQAASPVKLVSNTRNLDIRSALKKAAADQQHPAFSGETSFTSTQNHPTTPSKRVTNGSDGRVLVRSQSLTNEITTGTPLLSTPSPRWGRSPGGPDNLARNITAIKSPSNVGSVPPSPSTSSISTVRTTNAKSAAASSSGSKLPRMLGRSSSHGSLVLKSSSPSLSSPAITRVDVSATLRAAAREAAAGLSSGTDHAIIISSSCSSPTAKRPPHSPAAALLSSASSAAPVAVATSGQKLSQNVATNQQHAQVSSPPRIQTQQQSPILSRRNNTTSSSSGNNTALTPTRDLAGEGAEKVTSIVSAAIRATTLSTGGDTHNHNILLQESGAAAMDIRSFPTSLGAGQQIGSSPAAATASSSSHCSSATGAAAGVLPTTSAGAAAAAAKNQTTLNKVRQDLKSKSPQTQTAQQYTMSQRSRSLNSINISTGHSRANAATGTGTRSPGTVVRTKTCTTTTNVSGAIRAATREAARGPLTPTPPPPPAAASVVASPRERRPEQYGRDIIANNDVTLLLSPSPQGSINLQQQADNDMVSASGGGLLDNDCRAAAVNGADASTTTASNDVTIPSPQLAAEGAAPVAAAAVAVTTSHHHHSSSHTTTTSSSSPTTSHSKLGLGSGLGLGAAGRSSSISSSSSSTIGIRAALKDAERKLNNTNPNLSPHPHPNLHATTTAGILATTPGSIISSGNSSNRIEPEELQKALDIIAMLEVTMEAKDVEIKHTNEKLKESREYIQLLTRSVQQLSSDLEATKNDFGIMESLLMESGQTLTKLQDMYHNERDQCASLRNTVSNNENLIEDLEKKCEYLHAALKEAVGDDGLRDYIDAMSFGGGNSVKTRSSSSSGHEHLNDNNAGGGDGYGDGAAERRLAEEEERGEGQGEEGADDGVGDDDQLYDDAPAERNEAEVVDTESGGVMGANRVFISSSLSGGRSSDKKTIELSRYDIHGYHVKLRSSLRSMAESLFDELVRIEGDIAAIEPVLDIGKPVDDEVTTSFARSDASKRRPTEGPDFVFGSPSARLPMMDEVLAEGDEEEEGEEEVEEGEDDTSYQTAQQELEEDAVVVTATADLDREFAMVKDYYNCKSSSDSRSSISKEVAGGELSPVSATRRAAASGTMANIRSSSGTGTVTTATGSSQGGCSDNSDDDDELDAEQLRQMEEYFKTTAGAGGGGGGGSDEEEEAGELSFERELFKAAAGGRGSEDDGRELSLEKEKLAQEQLEQDATDAADDAAEAAFGSVADGNNNNNIGDNKHHPHHRSESSSLPSLPAHLPTSSPTSSSTTSSSPFSSTSSPPRRRGSIPSLTASGLDEDTTYAAAVSLEEIGDFQLRKKLLKQQLLAGYEHVVSSVGGAANNNKQLPLEQQEEQEEQHQQEQEQVSPGSEQDSHSRSVL